MLNNQSQDESKLKEEFKIILSKNGIKKSNKLKLIKVLRHMAEGYPATISCGLAKLCYRAYYDYLEKFEDIRLIHELVAAIAKKKLIDSNQRTTVGRKYLLEMLMKQEQEEIYLKASSKTLHVVKNNEKTAMEKIHSITTDLCNRRISTREFEILLKVIKVNHPENFNTCSLNIGTLKIPDNSRFSR